jgi:hypothetical protein
MRSAMLPRVRLRYVTTIRAWPRIAPSNCSFIQLTQPMFVNHLTASVKVGGKSVAYTSQLGKRALQACDALTKFDKAKMAAEMPSFISDSVNSFAEMYADQFADETSEDIEEELSSHFDAATARIFKKDWAAIQLGELAEANGWATAEIVLAAAAIVDPTGVVGAIAAYAKPLCKQIVPFPCTSVNSIGSKACPKK